MQAGRLSRSAVPQTHRTIWRAVRRDDSVEPFAVENAAEVRAAERMQIVGLEKMLTAEVAVVGGRPIHNGVRRAE
jgi:hypothetical protein